MADTSKLINLLPQEEFASSTLGRILRWILSTFRVIVIITEIVVMSAFASRFYLDARIANLKQEISEKTAVILGTKDFEREFRSAQSKISILSEMVLDEDLLQDQITKISSLTPDEVNLTAFSFDNARTNLQAQTPSEIAISQFIANLKGSQTFETVELLNISTSESTGTYNFSVDLVYLLN